MTSTPAASRARGLVARRLQIQPDIGPPEEPAEADHQEHRQIDDDIVAEEPLAQHRDLAQQRQLDHRRGGKARIGAAELEEMQQRRQPLDADGERDADDDLVQPEADAEQHDEKRDRHAAQPAGEEAEIEGAGVIGGDEARIGAEEHHPFDADIEHPGLLRDLLAEPGQQQGHAGGHGAEERARRGRVR